MDTHALGPAALGSTADPHPSRSAWWVSTMTNWWVSTIQHDPVGVYDSAKWVSTIRPGGCP